MRQRSTRTEETRQALTSVRPRLASLASDGCLWARSEREAAGPTVLRLSCQRAGSRPVASASVDSGHGTLGQTRAGWHVGLRLPSGLAAPLPQALSLGLSPSWPQTGGRGPALPAALAGLPRAGLPAGAAACGPRASRRPCDEAHVPLGADLSLAADARLPNLSLIDLLKLPLRWQQPEWAQVTGTVVGGAAATSTAGHAPRRWHSGAWVGPERGSRGFGRGIAAADSARAGSESWSEPAAAPPRRRRPLALQWRPWHATATVHAGHWHVTWDGMGIGNREFPQGLCSGMRHARSGMFRNSRPGNSRGVPLGVTCQTANAPSNEPGMTGGPQPGSPNEAPGSPTRGLRLEPGPRLRR